MLLLITHDRHNNDFLVFCDRKPGDEVLTFKSAIVVGVGHVCQKAIEFIKDWMTPLHGVS